MFRLLLGLVSAASLLTGTANAQDVRQALVKCVQQGLLDSGFDPNGVDGQIGGGTLAAASAWRGADADTDLQELNRDPDPALLRDWCYTLDPPVGLYGELFQIIKKQDGTFAVSDVGPVAIQYHEQSMWTRVRGVHRGNAWENNINPGALTPAQGAFIGALPTSLEILGTTTRISPDFLDSFGDVETWADRNGRTYAISRMGNTRRMVVFNGDEPYHLIDAATVEGWGDQLDAASDWTELERVHGIGKP